MIDQLKRLAKRLSQEKDLRLANAGDSLSFALMLLDEAARRADLAERSAEHYRREYEDLMADIPRIVSNAIDATRRS